MSPLQRFEQADWDKVPPHLHHQLERWLVDGRELTSRFLLAVLRNDLVDAVKAASPVEHAALADLVSFLINECPPPAYGSLDNVFAWRDMGGWRGMRNMTENGDKIYGPPTWRGRLWPPANGDDDE